MTLSPRTGDTVYTVSRYRVKALFFAVVIATAAVPAFSARGDNEPCAVVTFQPIFTTGSACRYTLRTYTVTKAWRDDIHSGSASILEVAEHTFELWGYYPNEPPVLTLSPSSTIYEWYPEICDQFTLEEGEQFPLTIQGSEARFECVHTASGDYAVLRVDEIDADGEPSELRVWVHTSDGYLRYGSDNLSAEAAVGSCTKKCAGFAFSGCGC